MANVDVISYEEFGKLRFLDFLPQVPRYSVDQDGGVEFPDLGLACSAGSLDTYFAWLPHSNETVSIALNFNSDCPEEAGNSLLKRLGLPVHKGMRYSTIKELFADPISDFGPPELLSGVTEVEYLVGSEWSYYLHCFVRQSEGLSRVRISRKDIVDQFEQWESNG